MKQIHINEARVTLATAASTPEFYGVTVELPEDLAYAVLKEQERKFELSNYLEQLRECGRVNTDPMLVPVPEFLKYEVTPDAEESETQPKPKRGRPPRVPQ